MLQEVELELNTSLKEEQKQNCMEYKRTSKKIYLNR